MKPAKPFHNSAQKSSSESFNKMMNTLKSTSPPNPLALDTQEVSAAGYTFNSMTPTSDRMGAKEDEDILASDSDLDSPLDLTQEMDYSDDEC